MTMKFSVYPAEGGAATSVLTRKANRVGNPVFFGGWATVGGYHRHQRLPERNRAANSTRECFLLDLTSGDLTDLSLVQINNNQTQNKPAGTNDLDPRFSPNGAKLIFTNTDNTGNGVRAVFTSDLDGRNRQQLFTPAEMPYWR